MKKIIAMLILGLLPACALAVEEGVVEDAPQVQVQIKAQTQEISYLPDASYYAGDNYVPAWEDAEEWVEDERFDGEMYHSVLQSPRLTAGEAKRAQRLLEDYQAGKIAYTGESVLEKMENVIVGVYALNPDDFDGETVFTLLPGPCMTDEQLFAVIDAHAQLGLTFDPAALNYRNCARGGGIEASRFFTEEERERFSMLEEKVRRGIIATDTAYEGLIRNPTLDSAYFCGMMDFTLLPFSSMTDEELISLLMSIGVKDESGTTDFDEIERRSRDALRKAVGTPLSMELSSISTQGSYVPSLFTAECEEGWDFTVEARMTYGATFNYYTPDGVLVYANVSFDQETDELVSASAMHDRDWDFPPEENNVTQEGIDAATAQAEAISGLSGLEWRAMTDDPTWTNWGECIPVRAQVAETYWMTVYVGADDGQAHGLQVSRGTLVDVLPEWPEQEDE